MMIDEHYHYVADEARTRAYAAALAEVVSPGDVVLDLGAGTGILGLLACRAGAGRVYAVDEGPMVAVARAVVRANGCADRVTVLRGHSTRLDLPRPVDVVVADQIGELGLEAGLIESFRDAAVRVLAPGGRLVPSHLTLELAPVECEWVGSRIAFWEERPAGLDFGPVRPMAANSVFSRRLAAGELLAEPATLVTLDLARAEARRVAGAASAVVTRAGTLHALGGWFVARLSPGISMTSSPLAAARIDRPNAVFPLTPPVGVAAGDRIDMRMTITPRHDLITWRVSVWGAPGTKAGRGPKRAEFEHSSFNGRPLAKEDLDRTRPDSRPRLGPWGAARMTAAHLCDGRRRLREIEQEVYRRHPDLFRSLDAAAAFVAGVISEDAR